MSIQLMADVLRHVHGIPSGRRMLLMALANYANAEGLCWPSIKSLAEDADLGDRHVSAELKELQKDGYITIEEHAGKPNHYRLTIPQGVNHSAGVNHSSSRTTVQGRGEPQFTPGGEPQFTQTVNKPSKNRQSAQIPKCPPDDFMAIWAEYPNKANRKRAADVWKKLAPDADLVEAMLNAIAQQKQTRQWRDGIVPHFTTWLNGERWLDEPIEAAARSVAPA
jgi:DNA-binding transcriptional MocR family regulator